MKSLVEKIGTYNAMNVIIEYFNQQCRLKIGPVILENDYVSDNYGGSPNQICLQETRDDKLKTVEKGLK